MISPIIHLKERSSLRGLARKNEVAKYKKKRARELQHDKFRDAAGRVFDRVADQLEGKGKANGGRSPKSEGRKMAEVQLTSHRWRPYHRRIGARPLGLGITHIFVGFVLDILICNLLMR